MSPFFSVSAEFKSQSVTRSPIELSWTAKNIVTLQRASVCHDSCHPCETLQKNDNDERSKNEKVSKHSDLRMTTKTLTSRRAVSIGTGHLALPHSLRVPNLPNPELSYILYEVSVICVFSIFSLRILIGQHEQHQ